MNSSQRSVIARPTYGFPAETLSDLGQKTCSGGESKIERGELIDLAWCSAKIQKLRASERSYYFFPRIYFHRRIPFVEVAIMQP